MEVVASGSPPLYRNMKVLRSGSAFCFSLVTRKVSGDPHVHGRLDNMRKREGGRVADRQTGGRRQTEKETEAKTETEMVRIQSTGQTSLLSP